MNGRLNDSAPCVDEVYRRTDMETAAPLVRGAAVQRVTAAAFDWLVGAADFNRKV